MSQTQIGNDLQKNFSSRIRQQVIDAADTFRRAGIPEDEAVAHVLAALMREAALGTISIGMSEKAAAEGFRLAYQNIRKMMNSVGLTDEKLLELAREMYRMRAAGRH